MDYLGKRIQMHGDYTGIFGEALKPSVKDVFQIRLRG
jgi:hypothetical protein